MGACIHAQGGGQGKGESLHIHGQRGGGIEHGAYEIAYFAEIAVDAVVHELEVLLRAGIADVYGSELA